MLNKVVSGFQTGSDIGGVIAASGFGIATGGWMPRGFLTESGPRPEYAGRYGAKEHSSPKYPPRTYANVNDSDATIRLAHDLDSPGEACTLDAIRAIKKPHVDVDLRGNARPEEVADFIRRYDVGTLNVAGNRESKFPGITGEVIEFMERVFTLLGFERKA